MAGNFSDDQLLQIARNMDVLPDDRKGQLPTGDRIPAPGPANLEDAGADGSPQNPPNNDKNPSSSPISAPQFRDDELKKMAESMGLKKPDPTGLDLFAKGTGLALENTAPKAAEALSMVPNFLAALGERGAQAAALEHGISDLDATDQAQTLENINKNNPGLISPNGKETPFDALVTPPKDRELFKSAQSRIKQNTEASGLTSEDMGKFSTQLGGLVGSLPAFIGAGIVGGVPAEMAMGAAMFAPEGYEEALQHGANESDAELTAMFHGVIGAGSALPVSQAFGIVEKSGIVNAMKETLWETMADIGKGTLKIGVEGSAIAVAQQFAQNLIAKDIVKYDPARDRFEGVGRAAGIGFAGGALLGGSAGVIKNMGARAAPMLALPSPSKENGGLSENAAAGPSGELPVPPKPAGLLPAPQPEYHVGSDGNASPKIILPADQARRDSINEAMTRLGLTPDVQRAINDRNNPRPPEPVSSPVTRAMKLLGLQENSESAPFVADEGGNLRKMTINEENAAREERNRREQIGLTPDVVAAQEKRGTAALPVKAETPEDIQAASSKANPNPSDAQKEAGNYQKGHLEIQGLPVTIETPIGAERKGMDPDGNPWSVKMPVDYGYIKGTEGNDGEHVDAYIGKNPKSEKVFIIDQHDTNHGEFDEHKTFLGFDNESDVRSVYNQAFSDGKAPERIGSDRVYEVPVDKFKEWLNRGDKGAPVRESMAEIAPESVMDPINYSPIKNDNISTPNGQKLGVQYGIAEADDLTASHDDDMRINKQYPKELQPRDRTRSASEQQISDILNPYKFDPRRLGEQPLTSEGAPIISDKGIVESGNGRTIALKRAYDNGTPQADDYKKFLEAQGYNVTGYRKPILVRVRTSDMTPEQRSSYIQDSNERSTAGMSATERALADGKAIRPNTLSLYRGGDIDSARNAEFVRDFMKDAVAAGDRVGAYDSEGRLSMDAARRIRGALLARAYGDPVIIEHIIESSDNDLRSVGTAILDAAAGWAQMREESKAGTIDPSVDITDKLNEAVKVVLDAKKTGKPVNTYFKQSDMFSEGPSLEARRILSWFYNPEKNFTHLLGRDKIADTLNYYVREARKTSPEKDLLGEKISANDILNQSIKRRNEKSVQENIFGQNKETVGQEPGEAGNHPFADEQGRATDGQEIEQRPGEVGEERPAAEVQQGGEPATGEELGGGTERGGSARADAEPTESGSTSESAARSESGGGSDGRSGGQPGAGRRNSVKIKDAGEKIGGARKDWKARGLRPEDLSYISTAEQGVLVTKDNVWPKPDYRKNVAEGANPVVERLKKMVRDKIASSPRYDSAAGRMGYTQFVSEVYTMLKDFKKPEDFQKLNQYIGEWAKKNGFGPGVSSFHASPEQTHTAFATARNLGKLQVDGWDIRKATRDITEKGWPNTKAVTKKAKVGGPAKPDRPHLDSLSRIGGEDFRKGSDVTSEHFVKDFGFRGVEFGNWVGGTERQQVVNLAYDALRDLASTLNAPPSVVSLGGKLSLAFGSRGRGGNAAAHYEPAKLVINLTKLKGAGTLAHEWGHALDHYLGELDVDKGDVAGAVYASGGRNVFNAERLKNLRNEVQGAFKGVMQSLFKQEVSRATYVRDQELALERAQSQLGELQTRLKAAQDAENPSQHAIDSLNSRVEFLGMKSIPEYQRRLQEIDNSPLPVTTTSFLRNAQRLDKTGAYWQRPTELLARSFEAYVHDKLQASGKSSDYLVHSVDENRYSDPQSYRGNPYPTGDERINIAKAYDNLFNTLKTRVNDKNLDTYYSVTRRMDDPLPTFYSALKAGVEGVQQEKAPAEQWRGILNNLANVKKEEMDWLGVNDWLAEQKGPVNKSELLQFIKDSEVDISEVMKTNGEQRYGAEGLNVLGGENYRELLLTLPKRPTANDLYNQQNDLMYQLHKKYGDGWRKKATPEEVNVVDELARKADNAASNYQSPHWNEANVLAHIRMNDRFAEDGKKTLHIEEVQSDWHQQGRKNGYKGELAEGLVQSAERRYLSVPDAPFKNNWHELAMKRMIRYAAEHDYDHISWTRGEEQAERYHLAKQIEHIEWFRNKDGSYDLMVNTKDGHTININNKDKNDLESVVGKDAAKKITEANGKMFEGRKAGTVEGEGLKVGGDGMKTFYDKMLPNFLNKYTKKWGAKVYEGKTNVADKDAVQIPFGDSREGNKTWMIDVTPKMRDAAMQGQPLFSKVFKPEFYRDVKGLKDFLNSEAARINPKVNVDFADQLFGEGMNLLRSGGTSTERQPVAGAFTRAKALIEVSLDMSKFDPVNTTYHELWHSLEDLLSPQERAILQKTFPATGNLAHEERAATSFASWAKERGNPGGQIAQIFAKLKNFIKQVGNFLTGKGFKTVDDIFEKAVTGEVGDREKFVYNLAHDPPDMKQYSIGNVGQKEKELLERMDKIMAGGDKPLPLHQRVMDKVADIIHADKSAWRQYWADRFTSIRDLEVETKNLNHINELDASLSAYKATRLAENVRDVLPLVFGIRDGKGGFKGGIPELQKLKGGGTQFVFNPNSKVKPLMEILRPIAELGADTEKLFKGYAIARRSERLLAEGRENLLTPKDIQEFKALDQKYPQFKKAFEDLQGFNKALLDLAESCGVIDPESRKVWENNDYVPFYREFSPDTVSGRNKKGGLEGQRSNIKQLKGGIDRLGDIYENIIGNTTHLMDASYKNWAMQKVASLMKDAGEWKEAKDYKPAKLSAEEVATKLDDMGVDVKNMTPEQLATYTRLMQNASPKDGSVVSYMEGGKPIYGRVEDPLLLRSLSSLNPISLDFIGKMMNFSNTAFRWTIVNDPTFLGRIFVKDSLNTPFVHDKNMMPVWDSIKGFRHQAKQDDMALSLMAAGGNPMPLYSVSAKKVRNTLARFYTGTSLGRKLLNYGKEGSDVYHQVGIAAEVANRAAIFDSVLKSGGSEAEAAYQAKDLRDYSNRGDGKLVQLLIAMAPFGNAHIQSNMRYVRAFTENPKSAFMKAGLLTAASVAYWAMMKDDERYKALPDWQKDIAWHFWAGGHHITIPKFFLPALVFSSLPETILNKAYGTGESKAIVDTMGRIFKDAISVNPFNVQFITPWFEQYANKNSYTGAPIVPSYMEKMRPEEQVGNNTPLTIQKISHAMPDFAPDVLRSPLRLDALVKGYTAQMGRYVLAGTDSLLRGVTNAPAGVRQNDKLPGILGMLFKEGEPSSTSYLQTFYDTRNEVDQIANSVKALEKNGDMEGAQKLLQDNPEAMVLHKSLDKIGLAMGKMNTQIRQITFDKNMSSSEKAEQIDGLLEQRNGLAKTAGEMIRNIKDSAAPSSPKPKPVSSINTTPAVKQLSSNIGDGDINSVGQVLSQASAQGNPYSEEDIMSAVKAAEMPELYQLMKQTPGADDRRMGDNYRRYSNMQFFEKSEVQES